MNKVSILSPVGDYESLRQAVRAGADEVYLGVKNFNARNIEGFDLQLLKQAVNFAHAFGVKVYLAINILFDDGEIQSALDLVVDSYNLGVDAFIVQDIGLARLIHTYYPMITMHASTQLAVHNLEGVRVLERLGFSRVVLSRETPLGEIKRIHDNSDIEIEYFVQGALCVCFSGNCYMSSYLEGASGNRGKCKQLCRLPYTLELNDQEVSSGYLLSAKDYNMTDYLHDLVAAGVVSLKIEGRARRPFYVYTATKYYRDLLDKGAGDKQELALAFNRGYTAGYFDGNGDIISNIQGHNGIHIGSVINVDKGKKFNLVTIKTSYPVSPKSTLKILRKGKELLTIAPFDVKPAKNGVTLTTTAGLKSQDEVYLLADSEKEQELMQQSVKKDLDIHILAQPNHPIVANITLNENVYTVQGEMLQEAKNAPLSVDDIETSFKKHEYFDPNISAEIDNVFMTKSQLNAFRRKCYEYMENINSRYLEKTLVTTEYQPYIVTDYDMVEDVCVGKSNIQIYTPSEYTVDNVLEFVKRCEKQGKTPYLDLPNVAFERDIELIKDIVDKTNIGIVVNNLYALDLPTKKIAGAYLNIYNSYSAEFYDMPCLIAENNNMGTTHKLPYMTMLHCPMKQFVGGNCANCKYRDGYTYRMQNGKRLKLKRKKLSTCLFYLVD